MHPCDGRFGVRHHSKPLAIPGARSGIGAGAKWGAPEGTAEGAVAGVPISANSQNISLASMSQNHELQHPQTAGNKHETYITNCTKHDGW